MNKLMDPFNTNKLNGSFLYGDKVLNQAELEMEIKDSCSLDYPHRHKHGRLKRQDPGEPEYFILDDTGPEFGTWGPWSAPRECSRPCGGGVTWQTRECYEQRPDGSPACRGASKKYFSCNIEECPTNVDFRSEQCAAFNNVPYSGVYYK
ncbi:hypothetical protein M8J77_008856 [Diaphorina citri]|nr:hypothetical protein M8J77_008856 [Diaphorina citri]